MKLFLTISLSIVISLFSTSYGQSPTEHLQNQLKLAKTDTQKVKLYNQLSELHFKDAPGKARKYA
ncbi:hypothetical protein, partial [Microscilla marina]|uniref:hypothetical protein n=1 Tax=Microscilla marina TaxID=1027 RepID=UPI0005D4795B